ncbi:MAG: TIGR04076 family protein [Clostridia bacterium]|nr:TIGR04076 family protein [Clostridia bacterium]
MRVRITAVRQTVYDDLCKEYENPIEHACDISVGDVFISEDGECPKGFCGSAWSVTEPFVKELASGGGNFFDGWMKNERSAMISCNDGFRPVSFYIEALEDGGNES